MNDMQNIIGQLRKDVELLGNKSGLRLDEIYKLLNSFAECTDEFEKLWIGAWGQEDYNYYRDPKDFNQIIEVTYEYFYEIIEKKKKVNLEKLGKEIIELLKPYKKFQSHLITELSVIRDNEKFKNEIELLTSLEKYKWGFEASDYVNMRMPRQIPVYNMSTLTKGVLTPPHITFMGYVVSLTTKSFSVKNFEELVIRILRQIEIKMNLGPLTDDYNYSQNFLKDVFDNFHSFYNQLKNRHANKSSIDIKDEYDVQDLIHSILKLHFNDVRKEEYTPSYAGSSTRVDFLLKNENIVIEIKKTRDKLADKEVGEQLILDIAHYKNHPNCKSLMCFVYDPENRIKNQRGLENDLNKLSDENMSVELYIRP